MLCGGRDGLSELLQALIRFSLVKTDPLSLHKPPTCFAVVKTDYPSLYKPRTRFAVVKTDCPSFYKLPTRFLVVKTDSPNFYKHPSCFEVVKTDFPTRTLVASKNLIHALRWSRMTLSFYKPLHAL